MPEFVNARPEPLTQRSAEIIFDSRNPERAACICEQEPIDLRRNGSGPPASEGVLGFRPVALEICDGERASELGWIAWVIRFRCGYKLRLAPSEMRFDEAPVQNEDVIGFHCERRRKVLLIEWFDSDEDDADAPLLCFRHALAEIFVSSKEVGVRNSSLR